MPSTATSNPDNSPARGIWCTALLASALAGCANLGNEAVPAADPPAKVAAPAQPTAAQAPAAQAPAKAPAAGEPAAASTNSAPPAPAAEKPALPAEQGARLEGSIASRLVLRSSGSDHDADFNNLISLDWSDPRHAWVKAHLVTRIDIDLDGKQAGNVFNGLTDVHNGAVDVKLYEAWFDIVPPEGLGQLRLGRQIEADTPEIIQFDGLDFRTQQTGEHDFSAGFYGGVPVRLYQGTSDSRSLAGAFVEERPWQGGRARVDWMHLVDETVNPSGNGILGLSLWQRFENGWSGDAEYTRLEDQDRDLRLHGQWTSPQSGFTAQASYYQLFQTQNQLPQGMDPYTSILMELFPYEQFGASISTEISEKITLDLAADARRVGDAGNLGEFNRDWERYRATVVLPALFESGFDLSVFDDLWNGDGRDISSWGLDLSYDTKAQWKFAVGSYYSLYKYDLFLNTERDDVRTYYGRANWKLSKQLSFELCYDYEDDSLDTYNALRGGAVWRF